MLLFDGSTASSTTGYVHENNENCATVAVFANIVIIIIGKTAKAQLHNHSCNKISLKCLKTVVCTLNVRTYGCCQCILIREDNELTTELCRVVGMSDQVKACIINGTFSSEENVPSYFIGNIPAKVYSYKCKLGKLGYILWPI
jgi:hypothetical protein